MTNNRKAFIQHRPNGVLLSFPNGNGLSTIWGAMSHSDNNDYGMSPEDMKLSFEERFKKQGQAIPEGSNTVEVMPDCSEEVYKILIEKFADNHNGNIFDYLTFPQWLEMVNILNTNK